MVNRRTQLNRNSYERANEWNKCYSRQDFQKRIFREETPMNYQQKKEEESSIDILGWED